MSWYRWLSCAVLLGVVDAAWLYLLLGLLGFVAGIGQAPLSWLVTTSVLVMGAVSRAVYELIPTGWRIRVVLLPCLGLLVAWLAIAIGNGLDSVSLGLGWPLRFVLGEFEASTLTAIVLSVVIVAGLWQQGGRRGFGVNGTVAIARSFRVGLVVFTLLLTFEALGDLDLGTRIAMGPFFVASLLAMAVARAPAHGVKLHAWLGLIVAAIIAALAVGLALALLAVAVVRGGFSALHDVWLEFAYAVRRSVSETLVELLGDRDASVVDPQSVAWEPSQGLMLMVVLLGAMVLAPLIYRVLNASPPPETPNVVLDLGSAEREPITESDSSVAAQLLEQLLPHWPWRRRPRSAAHALPAHPGLARVYALYYQLLDRARTRGVAVNPAHTPRERIASLRAAFPQLPVARLTAAFEAACYGRQATPRSELDWLAEQCESDRE